MEHVNCQMKRADHDDRLRQIANKEREPYLRSHIPVRRESGVRLVKLVSSFKLSNLRFSPTVLIGQPNASRTYHYKAQSMLSLKRPFQRLWVGKDEID